MRIHSLELRNVRGVEHLLIDDLPDTGVVVIHGPNESGKSTIAEAIDKVLNEKHTGMSKKNIKPLQPSGQDVGPEVTLEATVGPVRFRIFKRWLRTRKAELTILSPKSASYTGGEAEDKLQEILNDYLDQDLLSALFLAQDDLGEGIAAVGIPSLTGVLDEQSGGDSADLSEDTELLTRVEEEYERYFTLKQGNPTGEYKAAIKELEEAEEAATLADRQLQELDDVVERHESLEQQLSDAEARIPEAERNLEETQVAAEKAQQAQQRVEQQKEAADAATAATLRAREAIASRDKLIAEVDKAKQEAESTAAQAAQAKEAAEEEGSAREKKEAELNAAKEAHATAREAVKQARLRADAIADRDRLDGLAERVEKLDALSEKLQASRAQRAERSRTITDADVEKAAKAETELVIAKRLAEASAAKLILNADEQTTITVDGEDVSVDTETSVNLRNGTELTIAGLRARYEAQDSPTDEALRDAENKLAEVLDSLDVESVEQLRELAAAHSSADAELKQLEAEWTSLLGKDDHAELKAQHEALKSKDFSAVEGLDAQGAKKQLQEAEKAEDKAGDDVELAETALLPYKERSAANALARAESLAEAATAQAERIAQELDQTRQESSDEDLKAAAEKAEATEQELVAAHEAAAKELEASDAAMAQKLYEGAKANLQDARDTVHNTEKELIRLSSRIEQHAGVAEELEQAQARREAAREIHTSLERRANAAKYLLNLLHRHRDEARARYSEPFVTKLAELSRVVYGNDVSFDLDENLEIAARTQDGTSVGLEHLSGGAREQLAIITRFAIAELVGEGSSEDVPVIVDDALGSTDSPRLQLMATLFADAGRKSQVIVLTCMPQRYSSVPGKVSYDIANLMD